MNAIVRVLAIAVLLAGCPRPRHVITVPKNGNAQALARYSEAEARFKKDGNADEFKAIIQEYPQDPIVPYAGLYAAIAALHAHDFAEADRQLTHALEMHPDPALVPRLNLFLGITKNYEGDTAAARQLLPPDSVRDAAQNDDEKTEWLAALAYATAAGEEPAKSLRYFDELWGRSNQTERAMILARAGEVVAGLPADVLERAYDDRLSKRGPAAAVAGSRLVLELEQKDPKRAADIRGDVENLRVSVGLSRTPSEAESGPATVGSGDAGLIGAVLPVGSKTENLVAQRAQEGLIVAAGAASGSGVAAVEIRAGGDPSTAVQGVDDLARANAIAIIGPMDSAAVDAAASRADALGIPILALSAQPEARTKGKFVFQMRHSAESRARTLARRALAKNVTTFAVFAPENGYGKALTAAFTDEVTKGGGKVTTTVTYPKDAKSFNKEAGKLGKDWQAVFVPDSAQTLALVAPALAVAGYIPKPLGTTKLKGGRPVLLLSTAEGIGPEFLPAVEHHADGALLAPGFYPDDADPATKELIGAFMTAYNRMPGVVGAYAYDAARLAVAAGQGGRVGLARTLASDQLSGLTGTIKFDANHLRADEGNVYTVVEETSGFAIRVAR